MSPSSWSEVQPWIAGGFHSVPELPLPPLPAQRKLLQSLAFCSQDATRVAVGCHCVLVCSIIHKLSPNAQTVAPKTRSDLQVYNSGLSHV